MRLGGKGFVIAGLLNVALGQISLRSAPNDEAQGHHWHPHRQQSRLHRGLESPVAGGGEWAKAQRGGESRGGWRRISAA